MMKKLLLSVAFVATFGIINSFSQACTPDISCLPSNAALGICPDSATGLPEGCVGVPYNAVVSFKIPSSSSGASVTDVEVKTVTGLAQGLNWTCAPANCKFPGGTNGCVLISGTPTAVHNQNVVVNADAHVVLIIPITQPQVFSDYWSVINNCTAVGEVLDLTKFDVTQNAPNPFSEKSEIMFSSVANDNIEFKVYNVVGAVVYSNTFKAEVGVNTIKIEGNSFAPGVYIYSVTNGGTTITKRMIVSK